VLGAVDPVASLSLPTRQPLTIVIADASPQSSDASRLRDRLVAHLADRFDVTSVPTRESSGVIAIGDRPAVFPEIAATTPVWAVELPASRTPNLAVVRVDAADAHVSNRARISGTVVADGLRGRTSTIRLLDGPIVLAEQRHQWNADHEMVDITFDAVATRARVQPLRLEAVADAGERSTLDNARSIGVFRVDRPLDVMFFDARPSWATTFLRRAVESDRSFHVEFVTRVSRGISVRGVKAPEPDSLTSTVLSHVDALIVGAPSDLTATEVREVERFVRGGGSVMLVPDRRFDGAILDLLPGAVFAERLVERPLDLQVATPPGPRASEMLIAARTPFLAQPLASAGHDPVVFRFPLGRGVVFVDGALDAWRYRDAGLPFFRDLVRDAARVAVPPIALAVSSRLPSIGGDVDIRVTIRDNPADRGEAAAQVVMPDGTTQSVRLWPRSETGTFHGAVRPSLAGTHTVRVVSGDLRTETAFIARVDRDPDPPDLAGLRALATSHGGRSYPSSEIDALVREVGTRLTPSDTHRSVHPMRSPWWILPFASVLCAEWWLRRRSGLR
jgi:hypothetical protein